VDPDFGINGGNKEERELRDGMSRSSNRVRTWFLRTLSLFSVVLAWSLLERCVFEVPRAFAFAPCCFLLHLRVPCGMVFVPPCVCSVQGFPAGGH